MNSDLELKQKIEAEIRAALGDAAADIGVSVKAGVATLSGFARSWSDACIAEHAARRGGDLGGLANDIEVRLPILDERSDPDIARAAVGALEAAGLGPHVFVSVRHGQLTLDGEVASRGLRILAERTVRRLKGLKSVVNRLKTAPAPAAPAPAAPPLAPERGTGGVREAVCVVDSQAELEALVDELTTHGVDRTDISLMASFPAVYEKLGIVYRRPEEVADLPQVPRRSLVTRDDVVGSTALVFGALMTVGSFGAALPIVASGGALAAAVAAAVGGGAAAGALARIIRDRILNPRDAARLEDDLESGGLVVFVRVDTPEEEARALRIMREVGADSVHLHEIAVTKAELAQAAAEARAAEPRAVQAVAAGPA
jgi:osmotically-inducible protein OsmY